MINKLYVDIDRIIKSEQPLNFDIYGKVSTVSVSIPMNGNKEAVSLNPCI
jgi:hypothetical protein